MRPKEVIVKVQIPLDSNAENAPCFCYNKDRSVKFFAPLSQRFAEDCAKTGKAYYRIRVEGETHFDILERVKDRNW